MNTSLFKRTNYLISIIIFFVVSFVTQWLSAFIFEFIVGVSDQLMVESSLFANISSPFVGIVQIALNLFVFVLFYGVTRYLFDRKLEI